MDMGDKEWATEQAAAMEAIAPILDGLETAINSEGPVDLLTAYAIALGALREVDMAKPRLEQFVAVLLADRTHHAIGAGVRPD
jgi:hypothetical protein